MTDAPRHGHQAMALPTFFLIGAPKAGTTSLHHYLDKHPQIQMSVNKEPRFFAGPENGVPYAPGKVDALEEYERLFDPAVEVRGEASTDYATHPRRAGVPERIKQLVPDGKFLYLVRDPVARTISHYRMRVAFLGERRPLEEALSDLSDPRSPYIWPSLYATQLELYLRHFPQDSIMVIDQAELLTERWATLRAIFDFLSVSDGADSTQFDEVLSRSEEWRAYSPRYLHIVQRFIAPSLQWIPTGVRHAARRSIDRMLWPPLEKPALDGELSAQLHELYVGEVERLRTLTGQGFASWSL
jgi:hypothetical protein